MVSPKNMYIGQLHALSYQLPPHQAAIFYVSKYKAESLQTWAKSTT